MFKFIEGKLTYQEKLEMLLSWIKEAEAIIIGGASGMSTANGHDYYSHYSPFFNKHFADFGEKYNEPSAWKLFYHDYDSDEERWAYMARSGSVMLNLEAGKTYRDLWNLVSHKEHYVITTNQDAQFSKLFDVNRIFTVQGDAHWMQCSNRCSQEIYPSEEILHRLNQIIENGRLKSEDIPHCPKCGAVMEPWVKSYIFQYGDYWHECLSNYKAYLETCVDKKTLFLGLGIGNMTPEFIKRPFMQMTYEFNDARCAFVNLDEHDPVPEIANKAIAIDGDIKMTLQDLLELREQI